MSKLTSPYMGRFREILSRAALGFYSNSAEDTGAVYIDRAGWTLNENDYVVSAPPDDWFLNKRNQVITYGIEGVKCAALDGSSKLGDGCVLADPRPDGLTGLWSDRASGSDGAYAAGQEPEITVLYNTARKLREVMVSGSPAYVQFPVSYDVILYTEGENPVTELGPRDETAAAGAQIVYAPARIDGQAGTATFSVAVGTQVKQIVRFCNADALGGAGGLSLNVGFKKMTLRIKKWSKPGAVAKVLYFSREKNMLLNARDVQSIQVLEEKSTTATSLVYGISSNSCCVSLLDRGGRFTRNLDLLKRNRSIIPSVSVRGQDGGPEPFVALGHFYSDTWEMDSKSKFVKCKAYDELYALQNITVNFPYEKTGADTYRIQKDVTVFQLFKEVFLQINRQKHEREMYGVDIVFKIDRRLKDATVPFVILGERTAWETLADIAAYALCNVYCTRGGEVRVVCDIPPDRPEKPAPSPVPDPDVEYYLPEEETLTCAAVLPENCFTYRLPVQSKTVVNRVVMPYVEATTGKKEDNTLEIREDAIETVEYKENGVAKKKMVFSVKLKNFYVNVQIESLVRYISQSLHYEIDSGSISQQVFYDEMRFEIPYYSDFSKLILTLTSPQDEVLSKNELRREKDDKTSIRANGVSEYAHPASTLTFGKSAAIKKAEKILDKYNNGVTYTEVDWIGTPELNLGTKIACTDSKEKAPELYECLSNEFQLSGGLRCKSKLQKL